MFSGMKCIYCGYQMTRLNADEPEAHFICDCGATCVEDDLGVFFNLDAENRQNWINREFFQGLMGD